MMAEYKNDTKEILLQSHLAAIVQTSDDAIIITLMDGIIDYWNDGAQKIFGYSSAEVLGKSINILTPDKKDEHKEILEKYNTGKKLEPIEIKIIKKDGSLIDVSLNVSPIYDQEKKVAGFSIIARDITKRGHDYKSVEEEKRADESNIGNKELAFEIEEKGKRAAELIIANKELAFQNEEKEKRAAEKEKRAEELIIANKELAFQNEEKEKRAAELIIANKELLFQNEEKEKRAAELIVANKELVFQNEEKEKRAAELIVANKELAFQNAEKEKRAAELAIANKELAFQNAEKEKRAAELDIANKELAFQNDEKEKRANELRIANYARSLIEASRDPLVTISPEGKITDMNEATVNITGIERGKLIGSDFFNYFTEPQKAREVYQEVFAKGSVADSPLTLRHKDGKLTDVLFNGSVYKDDRGNVLGVVIVARDVTAQKLLSKYSLSLIEASLDPLVTISTEGKITDMNQATVNITGITREKLTGTDFFDYFTEPQKAREVYQEVFAKGSVADSPLTLRHKDGKLTDVLFNGSVYKDDRGNVLGVVIVARDVTAQKLLSKYSLSLIEASRDPLVTISPEGKITDMNEALVNITGESREKLLGSDFFDYFTEQQKAREVYQEVFAKGSVADSPLTLRHKDGKLTDVLFNGSVYKDDRGNVLGVVIVARDVTAQKLLSKYSLSLIEASRDPLVTISTEGKITDMNEALVNITGESREKLLGSDFFDYFTEQQKAREVYQEVFAKGSVADSPLTLRHKDGKLTDVLFNGSVYKDDRGNVLGVVIVARDVTAQKLLSKYSLSLIEASRDPLVTISPEGKITDMNEATVNITGIERGKLIGSDFFDYFTEPQKAREVYQEVFAKGSVADSPLTLRHKDGKLTDVLFNGSVYKDDRGNVLGVVIVARDVTEQKQLASRAAELAIEIAERKKESMKIEELEKFRKLTVGRESKMIELKKEIEELQSELSNCKTK